MRSNSTAFRSPYFFFFNDTATTEIYTLSLHDALPISTRSCRDPARRVRPCVFPGSRQDRKSTRLNSSHSSISYAVFCLKKKKPLAAISMVRDQIHALMPNIPVAEVASMEQLLARSLSRARFSMLLLSIFVFFFIVPATTEIYTLSLHDALPI